jgi:hypothetical protein
MMEKGIEVARSNLPRESAIDSKMRDNGKMERSERTGICQW